MTPLTLDHAIHEARARYASGQHPPPAGFLAGAVLIALVRMHPQQGAQCGLMWAPDERSAGIASAQHMRLGAAAATVCRLETIPQSTIRALQI